MGKRNTEGEEKNNETKIGTKEERVKVEQTERAKEEKGHRERQV